MGIAPNLVPSITLTVNIRIDAPLNIILQVLLLRLHLTRYFPKLIDLATVELGGVVQDSERWRQLGPEQSHLFLESRGNSLNGERHMLGMLLSLLIIRILLIL